MCGISGILKLDAGRVDCEQLGQMIAAVRHRGPDATGIHVSGPIGLAHARLSIIDLASGQQPMCTAEARFWITFNGEIFNYIELREELIGKGHVFLTRSDTEVILNAYREYGEDCVNHFNGQWAFAVWDSVEHKLFLSRDRVGIRPLFYTQASKDFIFASEIKALFACQEVQREIDPQGIDQVFTFWSTIPPRTVFKNVFQLPPGCSLIVENNQIRIEQYWKPPYRESI
jgi:asparagine synthase (glutamine-hydrolysing)